MSDPRQTYLDAAARAAGLREQLALREVEDDRREVEAAAALVGQDNPKTGKAHSWTSARDAVAETVTAREAKVTRIRQRTLVELAEAEARAAWAALLRDATQGAAL